MARRSSPQRHRAGRQSARRPDGGRTRREVAQVAARLMAEESLHDFAVAKSRAAARLGVSGRGTLPRNDEIESELRAYQALFQADTQPIWLAEKRRVALSAMEMLEPFHPRLAGAVLRGTAVEDAEITLHLFVDPPESVVRFLMDRGIPWELDSWQARYGDRRERDMPLYRIMAGGQILRLVVFPESGRREAPRSSVDGRPMARASMNELRRLLAEASD